MQFSLGGWTFKNPWILAPMAGVSEMPYRVLVRSMGASAAPTELVSAKGLLVGQSRSARYVTHAPEETPFWVQIFGGDPEIMAAGAAQAAKLGAQIIDVNMGCPVRKVTSNGAGSALLCDPIRAAAIVRAIVQRTGLPTTVKIRAGWDAQHCDPASFARRLEDAGCAAIALHARTKEQGYTGKADWSLIKSVTEAVKIPVIGNGDINTAAEARLMLERTGCAAVMIGRGALGNPWIFSELTTGQQAPRNKWPLIEQHFKAHVAFVDDALMAVRRFRPHFAWYARGLQRAQDFCDRINLVDDLQRVTALAEDFFSSAQATLAEHSLADFDTKMALG